MKTRFAPSPTGNLHIGGVRTALFSWLYAKKHGGKFVLRIEDTDQERSKPEYTQAITEGLSWLGIDWDEEPTHQSSRIEHYQKIAQQLIDKNQAYKCYCSKERIEALREQQLKNKQKPKYDGHCRNKTLHDETQPHVIRFATPQLGEIHFKDLIRGEITVKNEELDDVIILRSDGIPTYNFTVVIDDHEMEITHVIRGDDHINNTPRQINIYQALGWEPPQYAHVPMILGSDGKRLSKRHQALDVLEYRKKGILPQALNNYLVRLGWSHGDQEIFSKQEMIEHFDLDHIHHAPATFNQEKLEWLNQHYIKTLEIPQLQKEINWHLAQQKIELKNGPEQKTVIEALRERATTVLELIDQMQDYYQQEINYQTQVAKEHLTPEIRPHLNQLKTKLSELKEWEEEPLKTAFKTVLKENNLKFPQLGLPLRVALIGKPHSPGIDITLKLIGREKTLERLEKAIEYIG